MSLPDRKERLFPDGVPRYLCCYDNGGVTAERYTAVFTGLLLVKSPASTCISR